MEETQPLLNSKETSFDVARAPSSKSYGASSESSRPKTPYQNSHDGPRVDHGGTPSLSSREGTPGPIHRDGTPGQRSHASSPGTDNRNGIPGSQIRNGTPVQGSGRGETSGQGNIDYNLRLPSTNKGHTTVSDNNTRPPSLDIIGLSYSVKERLGHWWKGSCLKPAVKKTVLHNLCLSFNAGELTALVGSSGSGKTSLLDVISGRAVGEVTGVVSYKQEQCTRKLMQQRASYVLQADRLLPTLTARETLTFMAYLKLPGKFKTKDINHKVDTVLLEMGLTKVANTRIGGAVTRGVSGGEKRRITIGIQLLKNPDILLLDEPTTGLDSLAARNLVLNLADLARKGKLVVLSIHQPRSDIVSLLDKITLLTMGQLAFYGRPDQLVPYFTDIGFPCPKNENPCDIYVDVVSVDRRSPSREVTTMQRAKKVCYEFANSEMQEAVIKNITKGLTFQFDESLKPVTTDESPSWIRTFHTLLVRMNVHLYRDRSALGMRIFETVMSVPFIIMFLGRLKDNQGSIQDRLGLSYQVLNVPPFMGVTNAISLFPPLQHMMYRENSDGLYSIHTYLLAYYIHTLPFTIMAIAIYAPPLYWAVGMNSEFYAFGTFIIVSFILEQFAELLGVAMLALLFIPQVAYNASILIFSSASLISSGLLRQIENMPDFFQWAGYIPITKYAAEIIVGNEFNGLKLTCQGGNEGQCMKTGEEVLDTFYPHAVDNMNRNLAIMGGYVFAVIIFAWMMFKVRKIPTLY